MGGDDNGGWNTPTNHLFLLLPDVGEGDEPANVREQTFPEEMDPTSTGRP